MPATTPPVRIFVSYSHENAAAVQRLQGDLERAGATIWIDHESLIPGMRDWEQAVRDGIAQANFVIYAASPDARKSPYVRDEINLARSRGRDVIPFWVEGDDWLDCAPLGWGMTQYSDGRGVSYAAGLQRLLRRIGLAASEDRRPPRAIATEAAERVASIAPQSAAPAMPGSLTAGLQAILKGLDTAHTTHEAPPATPQPQPAAPQRPSLLAMPPERFPERLLTLGYTPQARDGVEWIIPPACLVPAGQFRLGSDKAHDPQAAKDELNRRTVTLPAFEIARFPVTVAEYACFVRVTKRKTPGSLHNAPTWEEQLQRLDHPVANVSWHDADDYAQWLAERTQQPWRLPTEAEWEKAARCDPHDPLGASSQRIYPWGDRFDQTRCNTRESGQRATTPVGWYGPDDPDPRAGRQSGASPCGAEELAGNVSEWLATAYADDYSKRETLLSYHSRDIRCLRGGSWRHDAKYARAACRIMLYYPPEAAEDTYGFRIVRAPPGSFH